MWEQEGKEVGGREGEERGYGKGEDIAYNNQDTSM